MRTRFLPLITVIALTPPLHAANFDLSGDSTSSRTLNAGETGNVQTGVSLLVSSGTAITLGANDGITTLTNSGTISQTGTGRTIRNNTSGSPTLIITNHATGIISAADADVIRGDVANSNWTITNDGIIQSHNASAAGNQAIDLDAITGGVVNITNNAGGQILATHADAIRAGANATIVNHGLIAATPDSGGSSSDGIDTQAKSGNTITNDGTISGRTGITGGETLTTYRLTVNNLSGGLISGVNGSGINTDGALTTDNIVTVLNEHGATIQGNVMASTVNGDGDGVDVDGIAHITNSGDILGYGAKGNGSDGLPNNAEGISIGGGTIVNHATGRIIGSTLASDAPNGDTSREGHGILVDNSSGGNALSSTSITNEGLIEGRSGYAIKMIGTFADTISNNAGGVIRGTHLDTASAAVQMGGGNDVLNNAGAIIHALGDTHTAISMEDGDDTVNILGGAATVTGGIDGGTGDNTLNFELGDASNTFTHSGAISNFNTVNAVSGTTTLNGDSTYLGSTTIGGDSQAAKLELNGTHINGSAYQVKTNGTLTGNGVITLSTPVSAITVDAGGHIAAGTETDTGTLTLAQGDIILNGTSDFRLDGTTAGVAGGYDQISLVSGNLELGANSSLSLAVNYQVAEGTLFTLFDLEDENAVVTGTFAGLAEGAEFTASNGTRFTISYTGGTGNDVVITAIPEPSGILLSLVAIGGLMLRRRK
ncbi:MAG: PEP-CTERM sorting domain-containing protein [Luteolibacter sp.]